jgi:segregation and condensation protein A
MTDYRVQLELFSGPLDLLLYLVRHQELDVLDLPMSRLTGQFLEFLSTLEFIDVDLAGDFIVTAAALAEIKSRQVLPQVEEELPEPELESEPHADLVRKLLEYKRFKEASFALEERAAEWRERYPRLAQERPTLGKNPAQDRIKEVELWDLVSALSRVLQTREVVQESRIRNDETPIAVWAERVSRRVLDRGECAFSEFFEGESLRSRIVGIFLAILELVRHHHFRAEQPAAYGEIWIRPPLHQVDGPISFESFSETERVAEDSNPES